MKRAEWNYRAGCLFPSIELSILIGNVIPPCLSTHSQAASTAARTISDSSTPTTSAAAVSRALSLEHRFGTRTLILSSYAIWRTVISAFCASGNELMLTDGTHWVISAHFC